MVKVSDITPYVVPGADVKTGDSVKIVRGLTTRSKTETGFDRDTAELIVKLPNGKEKPLTANRTTQKRLAAAFGDESDDWIGHSATCTIAQMLVRGTMKDVLYLDPVLTTKRK